MGLFDPDENGWITTEDCRVCKMKHKKIGRWIIDIDAKENCYCSNCKHESYNAQHFKYCPECGAEMENEK